MAVIVHDMNMPMECAECNFYDDSTEYPTCFASLQSMGYRFSPVGKRMTGCPLHPLPGGDVAPELVEEKGGVEMDKWITIDFKNGEICHYRPDEYTDYQYDGKYFIVIRDKQWIGLYNLDEIRYVEIGTIEEAEGCTNNKRDTFKPTFGER